MALQYSVEVQQKMNDLREPLDYLLERTFMPLSVVLEEEEDFMETPSSHLQQQKYQESSLLKREATENTELTSRRDNRLLHSNDNDETTISNAENELNDYTTRTQSEFQIFTADQVIESRVSPAQNNDDEPPPYGHDERPPTYISPGGLFPHAQHRHGRIHRSSNSSHLERVARPPTRRAMETTCLVCWYVSEGEEEDRDGDGDDLFEIGVSERARRRARKGLGYWPPDDRVCEGHRVVKDREGECGVM